jgi:hypothetical protein
MPEAIQHEQMSMKAALVIVRTHLEISKDTNQKTLAEFDDFAQLLFAIKPATQSVGSTTVDKFYEAANIMRNLLTLGGAEIIPTPEKFKDSKYFNILAHQKGLNWNNAISSLYQACLRSLPESQRKIILSTKYKG